jgi:hypothetical protein
MQRNQCPKNRKHKNIIIFYQKVPTARKCDRNTRKQNLIRKLILNSLDSLQRSKSESVAIRAFKPQACDKKPF